METILGTFEKTTMVSGETETIVPDLVIKFYSG